MAYEIQERQAPFLDYKGERIAQSIAIANFLAREFGLAGTTKLETARVEEIVQLEQEFFNNCLVKVFFEKDHARKVELLDKLKKEDIPRYFNHFEKLLEDNGTGYFVGHQLTLADIAVYDAVVNHVQTVLHVHDADHEQYPEVLALCDKVEANPNIQKYLEQQRD
nr:hypothetical protein BaRGS_006798 [Batillaria attramentaria]